MKYLSELINSFKIFKTKFKHFIAYLGTILLMAVFGSIIVISWLIARFVILLYSFIDINCRRSLAS
jgi:hypothetical protein